MKIEIITMHAARNYGAVLQTYALQKYLEDLGNIVTVIDYKRKSQTNIGYIFTINNKYKKNLFYKIAYLLKTIVPKIKTTILFKKFVKRKIKLSSKEFLSKDEFLNSEHNADIYCVGSDQVWNPRANNGYDEMYFFDGLKEKKKISYASSIGVYDLNNQELTDLKKYLSGFSFVSFREKSSINILKNIGIDDAKNVLDPTLLLNRDQWMKFSSNDSYSEKYLLVYYFGNSNEIMKVAKKIATERGLRIRRISVGFEKIKNDDIVDRFITPEKFISLLLNADFVLTNSFHGTVFSINFEKDFFVYPTTEHNARFESAFDIFDLKSRNLREEENDYLINNLNIDFNPVRQILLNERNSSYEYIRKAIGYENK